MRYTLLVAALAATTAVASPALAQQASATATAQGVVLQPLTLTKVSDLDFGTVSGSTVAGDVNVDPTSGVRTVGGGVTAVPSAFSRAQFQGLGQAGQTVQLTLTPPTGNLLYSGANSVTVNSMSLDSASAGGTITIGSGGNFTVYVGGDFSLSAGQPSGVYSGTFQLTAQYQ
jgi:hypothetical protein